MILDLPKYIEHSGSGGMRLEARSQETTQLPLCSMEPGLFALGALSHHVKSSVSWWSYSSPGVKHVHEEVSR